MKLVKAVAIGTILLISSSIAAVSQSVQPEEQIVSQEEMIDPVEEQNEQIELNEQIEQNVPGEDQGVSSDLEEPSVSQELLIMTSSEDMNEKAPIDWTSKADEISGQSFAVVSGSISEETISDSIDSAVSEENPLASNEDLENTDFSEEIPSAEDPVSFAAEEITEDDSEKDLFQAFCELRHSQVEQAEIVSERLLVVDMNFSCMSTTSRFTMGVKGGTSDSSPSHEVTLSPYMISTTEIPQSLYKMIMGRKSFITGDGSGAAVQLSWYDAIMFCNRLSLAMGYAPCYTVNGIADPERWDYIPNSGASIQGLIECKYNASGFRLPTEAEWEYAAKGGFLSDGFCYSGSDTKSWVVSSEEDLMMATALCNEIGLYDMSGNVAEWCNDWYSMYPSTSVIDPEGSIYGSQKVVRGGSFKSSQESFLVTTREKFSPKSSFDDVGFRVVRHIQSDSEVTTERQASAYSTQAERMEKERKRLQKKGNRRKSLGVEVNAYSNGAKISFTPDDLNNMISTATDFQDLGLLAGVNCCFPVANVVYLGLDAQVGLNAESFAAMNKGEKNLPLNINAMGRLGLNTHLLAGKLMRFSIFAEAGLLDFVPACGVGVDLELLSIMTERNVGIGIVFSGAYDVNQKIEGTLRYGISLEFLFPTVPAYK